MFQEKQADSLKLKSFVYNEGVSFGKSIYAELTKLYPDFLGKFENGWVVSFRYKKGGFLDC